jgi:activator of 2-hydroxyglutaryl-CoA dehydratase
MRAGGNGPPRPAAFLRRRGRHLRLGGQDIKVIILKNGRVKDFKLNTQCSTGNGTLAIYRRVSTSVESTPMCVCRQAGFGYGCAVFMQATSSISSARAGSRKRSWRACAMCCRNIWLYVSQIRISPPSARFLLQGGAVQPGRCQAQVDFIESRFKGKDIPADVIVHEHCGEAGAIGAALEAGRLWDNGRVSTFIGLDACF